MKDLSLTLSALLLFTYIVSPQSAVVSAGIYNGCPISNHLFYLWFHAGWLHLICNMFFLLEMGFFAHSVKWPAWLLSIIIAMCAPAFTSTPVVGFSGVLYALSGFAFCFSQRKSRPIIILSLLVLFQFLTGGIAVGLHLFCFSAAVIIGCLILPLHEIS